MCVMRQDDLSLPVRNVRITLLTIPTSDGDGDGDGDGESIQTHAYMDRRY